MRRLSNRCRWQSGRCQVARGRLRDLGITIGEYEVGPNNAITDVPGVLVGHSTVVHDQPYVARTGVTAIVPRELVREDSVYAGHYTLNGCGEMTGLLWVAESGLLNCPVLLTTTSQIGMVRDGVTAYSLERFGGGYWLPVVAETWDGWLNDPRGAPLARENVFAALDNAASGPVAEGNVGGGTGMTSYDFKGGIGTSSRLVETGSGRYTIGALVQANHGDRKMLRVDGVPVGREIGPERVPLPWSSNPATSSIIVVLATDAPLLSDQCRRLAQRATLGLARTGGIGYTFSGDIFLAFSTGNHLRRQAGPATVQTLPVDEINPLFEATAEAVEEAILNALVAAETMVGQSGHTAHALPLDEMQRVMAKHRPRV